MQISATLFSKQSTASVSRGTASLLQSPHHRPALETYGRQQLQANFYGPREWYRITRNRRNRVHKLSSSVSVQEIAERSKYDRSHPAVYPKPDAVADEAWDEYRRLSSSLFPGSPFDYEQRILDSWQQVTKDEPWTAEFPRHRLKGGVLLKQFNQFPFCYESKLELESSGLEISQPAHQLYSRIFEQCSPCVAADGKSLDPSLLQEFIQSVQTEHDVVQLLPQVLKRWRWVQMGGRNQHLAQSLNKETTSELIQKCLDLEQPAVAVHLLRYKTIYSLPAAIENFEQVMEHLLLNHLQQSPYPQPKIIYNPSRDNLGKVEEDEAREKQIVAGKRRIPKRLYQFRGVPRFYYYNSEPVVLLPETSPLDEFEMPSLPHDADTKRLMPDDQRKKMILMILERRRAQHVIDSKLEESYRAQEESLMSEGEAKQEWTRAMDDLARVYYFATSKNPRFYGLAASPYMNDLLSLAGLTQSDESIRRSRLVFEDASALMTERTSTDQLMSNSGLLPLVAAEQRKPDSTPENEDKLVAFAAKNHTADKTGLSSLLPYLLPDRRVLDYLPGGVHSLPAPVTKPETPNPLTLQHACVDKLSEHLAESIQKQLGILGTAEERTKLQEEWKRTVASSGLRTILESNERLNSVWNN